MGAAAAKSGSSRNRAAAAGSVLFVSDPGLTNRLQRIAVEETRLGIPLIVGFDDLSIAHRLRAHDAFRALGADLMEYAF